MTKLEDSKALRLEEIPQEEIKCLTGITFILL
jgi:hypothetical protein